MDLNISFIFRILISCFIFPDKVLVLTAPKPDIPAVRVNCKTPGLMLFQIYEPKVRALLKSSGAKKLVLFSEDPQTKQPMSTCNQIHTIREPGGWSDAFTFLRYGNNSSCIVKSYLADIENTTQETFVADIFIKVLSTDDQISFANGQKRGRIRLSCTMMAARHVESGLTKLRGELSSSPSRPIPNVVEPPATVSPAVGFDLLTAQLAGSLMLRFFKLLPGSNTPVPAVTVIEGEDIYLVAALRSGGSFAVLRPVSCVLKAVINLSPSNSNDSLREMSFRQIGASNSFTREFSILKNGCQTAEHPWEMAKEAADNNVFRLYYTKFLAPSFTGTLRLSAKCSINLCTQQNSNACIAQPKSLLDPTCFGTSTSVPNFPFHSETITNISELQLQPATILMTAATRQTTRSGMSGSARRSSINATSSPETKEDKGIFKRNISHATTIGHFSPVSSNWSTATASTVTAGPSSSTTALDSAAGETADIFGNSTIKPAQEIRYCFSQSTVTMAAASVVVVLILSVILVSFSILTHCRQRGGHDRVAILDDLQ